jgi:hypothetical protein
MDFKQKTIDDIIESEHLMVSTAPQRYGAYYTIELDLAEFLSSAVKSVNRDHAIFVRFLSQVKKHHLLAVFSTVRQHQIQAMMNLRQVLENGACAAFAIANPEPTHFASTTPEGTLDTSNKLNDAYKWLKKKFPQGSARIKAMKDDINSSIAHANIVYTQNNFRLADSGNEFGTPFFDIVDEYFVRSDLLMASGIALSLIKLFYGVNKDVYAIVWRDDFESRFASLFERETALRSEMHSSDRFKEQQRKIWTPCEVSLEIVQPLTL